uniref:(northern house mosquito) hypothetical protein n=1 Tax=Culex pipiens TaxID=7175 RepID=A0A8D8JJT2_CULPI
MRQLPRQGPRRQPRQNRLHPARHRPPSPNLPPHRGALPRSVLRRQVRPLHHRPPAPAPLRHDGPHPHLHPVLLRLRPAAQLLQKGRAQLCPNLRVLQGRQNRPRPGHVLPRQCPLYALLRTLALLPADANQGHPPPGLLPTASVPAVLPRDDQPDGGRVPEQARRSGRKLDDGDGALYEVRSAEAFGGHWDAAGGQVGRKCAGGAHVYHAEINDC